jgi:hypothetical protein
VFEPVDAGPTTAFEPVGPTADLEPVDAGPTTAFEPAGPTNEFEPAGPTNEFEPAGPTNEFEPAGPTTVFEPVDGEFRPGTAESRTDPRRSASGGAHAGPTTVFPPAGEDDLRTELFTHGGDPSPPRTPWAAPPDPDEATQVVAPLPFGGPGPERAEPPAWAPAPTDGDPSGPLGFPGERTREDGRRRNVAALLAVVALVVVAILGAYLLIRGVRGSADGDGGGGGTSAPTPAATATGPRPVPAGYTTYQGDGFTIGVPDGWTAAQAGEGVIDVKEPGTSRFLRLITVGGSSDSLRQLTGAEKQFSSKALYQPYERIRLGKVSYRGYDAADWEFRFRLQGQQRHVVYRGVVTGGRSYGIYLSAPEDRWAESTAHFKVAVDTFRPTA